MSGDRDGKGRFREGGASANPKGRPKGRSQKLRTQADLAEAVLELMNRKVPTSGADGEHSTTILFKRNVARLMSGDASSRLAAKETISLARWASVVAQRADAERERQQMVEDELRRRGLLDD
jgi:hypothetical protein